jgi:hypothetical protein
VKFALYRTTTYGDEDSAPCKEAIKTGNGWEIELNSLGELIAFGAKYGSLVIEDFEDDVGIRLEIYDGWRE